MHCRTKPGSLKIHRMNVHIGIYEKRTPAIHHIKMSRKDPIYDLVLQPLESTIFLVEMPTVCDKFMSVLYKSFICVNLVQFIVIYTQRHIVYMKWRWTCLPLSRLILQKIVKKIFYDGFEIFKINLRYTAPCKVKSKLIAVCNTTFFICNKSFPGECLNLFAFNLLRYCILNGINFVVLCSIHPARLDKSTIGFTYIGLGVV